MDGWEALVSDAMDRFAKENDCSGIELWGRKGWLRRLAKYGYEEYGIDILMRYYDLISRNGETYLWYFPDGKPSTVETSTSPEAKPTVGWGSSAMLYAFVEGLVGIQDKDKLFRRVRICPKWIAAGVEKAEVKIDYKSSGAFVKYLYSHTADRLTIKLTGSYEYIQLSLPVPGNWGRFWRDRINADGPQRRPTM
jgi:hypothetical protein